MNTIILFRVGAWCVDGDEFGIAKRYMRVETNRSRCANSVVIGRYSVLPFYKELEDDLADIGSRLINSYDQHLWIANFDYYADLADYTFESWTEREFSRTQYEGPFVVKGLTNSKKHQWDTMMFARDRREAIEVASRLRQDSLIGTQPLVYRRYTPLVTFETGLNGLNFTNEWRLFFLGETLIAYGYYWTEAEDVTTPQLSGDGLAFAKHVAKIAAQHSNFFVLDIGEKQEGGWVLVEVNDGQMSGLSMIDANEFYKNLAIVLK
jgi:hypothetical protein